jgi:hypothetical protein
MGRQHDGRKRFFALLAEARRAAQQPMKLRDNSIVMETSRE